MTSDEETDGEDNREAHEGKNDAPSQKVLPEEPIGCGSEKPHCAERVREEHERDEGEGDKLEFGASTPNEGEAKAGQCDGQIVVHETHVKDVAVGEHGEERREEPGRTARGNGNKREDAPEEEEDAKSDSNFFGGGDAEEIRERKEQEIEEDVFPLPDGVNAGGSSLLDELGEPGVVHMAAQITGFDVGVPEDGSEKEGGEEEGSAEEEFHCIAESITRVLCECRGGFGKRGKKQEKAYTEATESAEDTEKRG
jgi:hypothetical protein